MIELEKKLKELAGKLNNKNKNVVRSAIISLRHEDPFAGAIRLLIEVFNKTDDIYIKDLIRNFMNDLKESDARPEVIAEIKKSYKSETAGMLVSSCWQSGLDYSAYTPELVMIFLNGDYVVSLECLTVIEESLSYIPRKKKNEMIAYLEKNKGDAMNEKSVLVNELISILS